MIHCLATANGRRELDKLIERQGRSSPPGVVPTSYDSAPALATLESDIVVFTGLGSLSPHQLEQAASIWKTLSGSGRALRLLNHPLRIMRRYELLRELHERGINDFDACRLTEARAPRRFPVFLQIEHGPAEDEIELLWTPAELEAAVDRLAEEGETRTRRLVVEFAGEADTRAFHRTFSAYCLAGRVIPGHLVFSRRWRARTTDEPVEDWMLVEERAYLSANAHADLVRGVFRLARVDFGRVEFGVVGGRVQIYGIDTTPVICVPSDDRQAAHFPRHLVGVDRLIEGLNELSRLASGAGELPIAAGEDARAAPP